MKLRLKNFRCYEKAEFDFGENGLTLISGSSGKGKSTLMLAIEFALFGTGNKLQTYGKKGCSVELEINSDFKIFRQKAPNRLVVNDIYEDDAGESVIREKFGTNMLTSYIPQNIRKTFILMSPAERLEFLESLISTGTDIQEIKASIKSVIKKLGDEHNETIGALKAAETTLTTFEKPAKPGFCSKHTLDEQQKLLVKIDGRISTSNREIKDLYEKSQKLNQESRDITILQNMLDEKASQLVELNGQLDSQTTEVEGYLGDDNLDDLKETFRTGTAFEELQSQYEAGKNTIDEMRQSEKQTIEQRIQELRSDLWVEFSKDEAIEQELLWKEEVSRKKKKEMLQKTRQDVSKRLVSDIESLLQRISELNDSTVKLKKDIEVAEFPLHKCPHCRTSLRFTGKTLICSDGDVSEKPNVATMKAELKKQMLELAALNEKSTAHQSVGTRLEELDKEIAEIGDVEDGAEESLDEMTQYISKNKNNEEEIQRCEKTINAPSKSIQLLMKKNEEVLRKMKEEKFIQNLEEVEKNIKEQEKLKNIYDTFVAKKKKLLEQISKLEKDSLSLKEKHQRVWKKLRSSVDVNCEIDDTSERIKSLQLKIEEDEKKRDGYKISIEYKKQFDIWKKLLSQKELLVSKEEDVRKRYASACTFREKILEAESIAITNMINTINTHAQFYLDHFFQEEPITIQLVAFKETKDASKPQINLTIDYKGIDHDLTMLSGGELSRVILAFTLALAEIHDTPFVMLDESTSSLDQDLTGTVVEGLRENFGNKLVIIIAHQVVQGVFDKVVNLNN